MSYLKKERIFFERDENGKVIPLEITLEALSDKPMIKATPLTKGELNRIAQQTKGTELEADTDVDIIINHCIEPKFEEEDREALKSASKLEVTNAITIAILSMSTNMSQGDLLKQGKKTSVDKELSDFQQR